MTVANKKIAYLVTEDWYFISHRLELARLARESGHAVYVLTKKGDKAGLIKKNGFELIPVDLKRGLGSPLSDLYAVFFISKILRQLRPEILHNIALKPVFIGSLSALFARVPVIINAYTGLGYLFTSGSILTRITRTLVVRLLAFMQKRPRYFAIVQNPDDRHLLETLNIIDEGRTCLIPGAGINPEDFPYSQETTEDPVTVMFASRLLKDKGIIDFVDAARQLAARYQNIRFIVVGDIDPSSPTTIRPERINQWVDEGIVEWWGHRDDMPDVLKLANIVCLPSYREGLPKVLLEASACGRAIITTDVPGCREVVVDGINGLLVPPKDANSLAEAIEQLINVPEQRRQMGIAGRERIIKHFNLQKVNTETLNLYNNLL